MIDNSEVSRLEEKVYYILCYHLERHTLSKKSIADRLRVPVAYIRACLEMTVGSFDEDFIEKLLAFFDIHKEWFYSDRGRTFMETGGPPSKEELPKLSGTMVYFNKVGRIFVSANPYAYTMIELIELIDELNRAMDFGIEIEGRLAEAMETYEKIEKALNEKTIKKDERRTSND